MLKVSLQSPPGLCQLCPRGRQRFLQDVDVSREQQDSPSGCSAAPNISLPLGSWDEHMQLIRGSCVEMERKNSSRNVQLA